MKKNLLNDLQNFSGILIGLIMISIGSVMFLNAGARLYIFGFSSGNYFSAEDQCESSIPSFLLEEKTPNIKTEIKTPEEIQLCIKEKTIKEKKRYTRDKIEDIISGAILIIIGFPLWFFHRKRNNKKK